MKRLFVPLLFVMFWPGLSAGNQPNGDPLTLPEAIEIALQNNARLQAARAALAAAEHQVQQRRLDLLPKADVRLSYARLDDGAVRRAELFTDVGRALVRAFAPESDPQDIRQTAFANNFATSIQVVQPVYNGGANLAAIGMARARENSDQHLLEDTKQKIVLQVKERYLRVLQASEFVTLAQKTLESSREHLKTARKMLEVGLRSRTEVLRWQVQTANSKGQLVEAENNHKVALAALKQVLGLPFSEPISVAPLTFEPEPLTQPLEAQLDKTRSNHPGLRAASATVDAGHAGVRLAWAAFQPQVNFLYEFGWERNNTLALDSFTFWSAGVNVRIPIFHSFSNLARLHERKADLRELQANETETERLLTLELIRARSRVETTLEKYRIAGTAVEQARENLSVLDNTYEAGLAANIDVLDAQVVLTQAETQLINARYDYWIARAELDRAMGELQE